MDYGLYDDVKVPFIAGKIWHWHSKYWNISNISIQRMRQLNVFFFQTKYQIECLAWKWPYKMHETTRHINCSDGLIVSIKNVFGLLLLANTNLAQRLMKTSVALPRNLHWLKFNVYVHCLRRLKQIDDILIHVS